MKVGMISADIRSHEELRAVTTAPLLKDLDHIQLPSAPDSVLMMPSYNPIAPLPSHMTLGRLLIQCSVRSRADSSGKLV